jgi:UDP-N-acetylmuramyl pentapeptide phosphotransferase/UDP-N-acetylglucosamine-1-phosphate transferase
MLYHLTQWIWRTFDPPGFGVFQYVTFRVAAAAITALLLCFLLGPAVIRFLQRHQVQEHGKPELQQTGNHAQKQGTPTMGGILVLLAILLPTLLWAKLTSGMVLAIVLATAWMGAVGFVDDYLKVVKRLPNGLIARYKLLGQMSLGLLLGGAIVLAPEWFSPSFPAV